MTIWKHCDVTVSQTPCDSDCWTQKLHSRWHVPLTVQSSGRPRFWNKPLAIFVEMTSFWAAAVCSPEIFVFCKVSKSNNEFFLLLFSPFYRSANVPFHLFPRKSVNHVKNQSKQPTLSFIVCRRGFGLGQVGYSQTFSGHVPLQHFVIWACTSKTSYDKKAEENNKNIFTNKHLVILKIIFTDVDLCINTSISKWIIRKYNFSLPLLTSNVPSQIGKSTTRVHAV